MKCHSKESQKQWQRPEFGDIDPGILRIAFHPHKLPQEITGVHVVNLVPPEKIPGIGIIRIVIPVPGERVNFAVLFAVNIGNKTFYVVGIIFVDAGLEIGTDEESHVRRVAQDHE